MPRRVMSLAPLALMLGCRGVSPDPAVLATEPLPASASTADARAAASAHAQRALAAWEAGQPEQAEEAARDALDRDPGLLRARAILGRCLQERAMRQTPPDLALLNQADGETLRAATLAPADPVVGRLRAGFLERAGHITAAAAAAESALAQLPSTAAGESLDPDRVALIAMAADLRYELGEERQALPWLRQLTTQRPGDARAWFRLGVCLAGGQDAAALESAAAAFQRSAELTPADRAGWLAQGSALYRAAEAAARAGDEARRERHLVAAAAVFGAAAEQFPADGEPCFRQGLVLESAADPSGAAAAYRRALQRQADHGGALLNLAGLLAQHEAEDPVAGAEARELLRRALDGARAGTIRLTPPERERIEAYLRESQRGR